MTDLQLAIAVVVGSYLAGSIPFGLLLARGRGVDIREAGSGNIGATNVARTVGKKLGAVVLVLDACKGAGPVALAMALALTPRLAGLGAETATAAVPAAAGFAAICGHCFPVWLRFRGGKGVATSLGVFLVIDPLIAGIGVALFAVLYALFRIASVGSMTAALAFPALMAALGRPVPEIILGAAAAAIVILKHRGNLARLLRRQEHRV